LFTTPQTSTGSGYCDDCTDPPPHQSVTLDVSCGVVLVPGLPLDLLRKVEVDETGDDISPEPHG